MRPEGQALAGFYATPEGLVAPIARLVQIVPLKPSGHWHGSHNSELTVCDPCAGDAAAITSALRAWGAFDDVDGWSGIEATAYVAELEEGRAKEAQKRLKDAGADPVATHGDAHHIAFAKSERAAGVDILWLNPPYDHDKVYGRLEERWLVRFADALRTNGALVFIVPHYALEASARTLATGFAEIHAFRFPDGEFEVYRQCVVVARRADGVLPLDPRTVKRIEGWARDAKSMPVLPTGARAKAVIAVPISVHRGGGLDGWKAQAIDVVSACAGFTPWRTGTVGPSAAVVPGILPDVGPAGYLTPTFPVAAPLAAGHVAPALACGVFDGVRLRPNLGQAHLPEVLLRVTYERRWETTEYITNKDGETTGEKQVQVPELAAVAMDLQNVCYVDIDASAERTAMVSLATMTMADVVEAYGDDLRAALKRRCPPLFDPERDSIEGLAKLGRPLYPGQVVPAATIAKLVQTEGAALLLGSTGVGKTTVATAVATTLGAKRVLVLCPPHLLDDWTREIVAVAPGARCMVIGDVLEADAFARAEDEGPVFGIVAETTGKLSHGWAPVARCGRCGTAVANPDEAVRKRQRCGHAAPVLDADHALAQDLAAVVLRYEPSAAGYARVLPRVLQAQFDKTPETPSRELDDAGRAALAALCPRVRYQRACLFLLLAVADDDLTARTARRLYRKEETAGLALDLVLTMAPGSPKQRALLAELAAQPVTSNRWSEYDTKTFRSITGAEGLRRRLEEFLRDPAGAGLREYRHGSGDALLSAFGETFLHFGARRGSAEAAVLALRAQSSRVGWSEPCGEPLFQADASPRRIPVVEYLTKLRRPVPGSRRRGEKRKQHPRFPFDLAIVDEIHRYANEDSAVGMTLTRLTGTPIIGLSGSMMNGYAESLFNLLRAVSRPFRGSFARDERARFQKLFGFSKRRVDYSGNDDRERAVRGYGSQSDRVERVKASGAQPAPGVVPSLYLSYLLRSGVVLHLEDLGVELPPIEERVELMDVGEDILRRTNAFRRALATEIKANIRNGLGQKLFGAMAEEWSTADLISRGIGNSNDGVYRAVYPASSGHRAGDVVAELEMMDPEVLLPKEKRLLEIIQEENAAGRNCLISVWHRSSGLPDRIASLVAKATGKECLVLDAERVPARKRDAWIREKVVRANASNLVVQPAAVDTGLNSLVHFATLIHFELPGCDPRAALQVRGRIRRPGQKKPQKVIWLVAKETSQERVRKLVLHKMAEVQAVHAMDPSAAYAASGIGTGDGMSGYDLGRQLYLEALGEAA